MSEDPFLRRLHERPIGGTYELREKISAGGYGEVYLAQDMKTGVEVALKLEHRSIDKGVLGGEFRKYQELQGVDGIPEVYWYGSHDDYMIMAFELLGPSLEDVFAYCEYSFTLKTILMIFDQLLHRMELLHSRNVIHCDIKPTNFLLGCGRNGNKIYVADLGISTDYWPSDKKTARDGPPRAGLLIGTTTFASIRAHENELQNPFDDLESLGYMMIYLALGGWLPWDEVQAENDKDRKRMVMEMKFETTAEELCEGLPEEFATYMDTVMHQRETHYPPYQKLRASFRKLAEKLHYKYDNVFDWQIRMYLETDGGRVTYQGC